jgi:small GTP-binding protein
MDRQKSFKGEKKSEPSPKPEKKPAKPQLTPTSNLLPDLPNYDPEPADGVRVGDCPVPGLTLKRILRGHKNNINRIAWSPDGRLLASPSADKTIRIWDVACGECVAVLEGHTEYVSSVAWSPNGQRLASGSHDKTIRIWSTQNWKYLAAIKDNHNINIVSWSPTGYELAYCSWGGKMKLCDMETFLPTVELETSSAICDVSWSLDGHRLAFDDGNNVRIWNSIKNSYEWTLLGHSGNVYCLVWFSDQQLLASGSRDNTIRLWDLKSDKAFKVLEGHTGLITDISSSSKGWLLATKSEDDTIRIWRTDTWETVGVLREKLSKNVPMGIAFHPHMPCLATLGENDTVIRIWDLDMDRLLGQTPTNSIHYTTAKLVLVGDSGVGKTGLGWRLAHGEFKEHASTHGQQFWVVGELGTKRKDGTECEAVLWDLAGQHVYRSIHSIFLDNVDASLVLFDPTNRQEPLKGAQFWLEQLKGKGQLPPSVLVGARVDRGAPAISQEYLAQFCQRYGISGGYIGTSAFTGEGLLELIKLLQAQIPWDKMTTTVTTVTFKRIKDYVLELKEKPDRKGVLVQPAELRQQLQATNKDWKFTDAEMITAVGHLETHGYVTILKNSAGETYILLAPDLLVDLASSIVLLADKHPRELGAVNETELLSGRYSFDELKGLEEKEQHTLLDAAVLRFLEHNVCFRETFGNDTLLIFPGLIKQKRPLDDDLQSSDDMSYVVRGRVENLYAMMVVLLGYTPSFSRINQWQNQAQYEMGKGEICGFRMIADREGEIELVLYYSTEIPQDGRRKFQELFEQFLYQREVEVTRFPPVLCQKGHRLERATVIRLIRESKTFVFCAECGGKVDLPKLEKPGIGTGASIWLQREEATARLRSTYESHLSRVKGYRRERATPRCYLSRAPGEENLAEDIAHDLKDAGVYIIEYPNQVQPDDYIVILDTPDYQRIWHKPTQEFVAEFKFIKDRMAGGNRRLISIVLEGKPSSTASHDLRSCTPGDFCDVTHYPVSLFDLVLNLYAIPFTHAGFAPLRESLHQQWEHSLAGMVEEAPKSRKRFDVALSFPSERREYVKKVADRLASQLGSERVFYDANYQAELARPDMDTYLQEIYHDKAELLVVFLCAEYKKKEWCGLEWRAVRDILKQKKTADIMPVRLDNTNIPGLFSIDGYIDAKGRDPAEIADLILQRLRLNR